MFLNIRLQTINHIIFESEIRAAYLPTKDGQIGILKDHETMSFEIIPGQLILELENGTKKNFYIGFGLAEVDANLLSIAAFPIAGTFEEFEALNGENLLMDAPSEVDENFLKELKLKIIKDE
jgi:F0F1-type ATP synthase epsilon subunit